MNIIDLIKTCVKYDIDFNSPITLKVEDRRDGLSFERILSIDDLINSKFYVKNAKYGLNIDIRIN